MAHNTVVSPVTGVVWQIVAQPGDQLAAGAEILLIESMKMEIPVSMPRAGRLLSLSVKPEDPVTEGQIVATLE